MGLVYRLSAPGGPVTIGDLPRHRVLTPQADSAGRWQVCALGDERSMFCSYVGRGTAPRASSPADRGRGGPVTTGCPECAEPQLPGHPQGHLVFVFTVTRAGNTCQFLTRQLVENGS